LKVSDAIEAKGLTRWYSDLPAADHVGFHVRRGEIFGYLGPNGAATSRSPMGICVFGDL